MKQDFFQQASRYLRDLDHLTTDLELKNEAAYFFVENGAPEQAISILRRSFASPKICANLGLLMLAQGQLAKAEDYLTLAMSYNPKNTQVRQTMKLLKENEIAQKKNNSLSLKKLLNLWSK